MKKTLLILLLLGGAIGAYGYYGARTVEFVPDISTVTLTAGDIADTVGATGALEAVTTVKVGSQVSGIIQELNVDFNSIVRENDVIMRLDPSLFETQIEQARANLLRAEADVERLRVAVDDTATQLTRAEDLASRDLIADTELEAAQVALRSAEAQTKSAEAQVVQAQATLNQNEVNLEHTVIRAPIDGIVISRLVDIGQTVAASFQAPELFVIAADLTKMRVIANIDESDVGRIRPNQRVTFTVDAFPVEEFEGTVSQVRLEPVVQQNVVTYATVIDAPNPELKLKPGMTATVSIEIAGRQNVMRIPNAALRFRPTPDMFAALGQPVPQELQTLTRPSDAAAARSRSRSNVDGTELRMVATPPDGRGRDERSDGPTGPSGPSGRASGPDGPDPERRREMMERVQSMSPEEREQFFARMRARRAAGSDGPATGRGGQRQRRNVQSGPVVPAVERGATTIDALFAPVEITETNGRVWLMNRGHLSSVDVTLGVTDGTASEFLRVRQPAINSPLEPAKNPQVIALRQQLTSVENESARAELEAQLAALHPNDEAGPSAAADAPALLGPGAQLVTNVSTPEPGISTPTGSSASPLLPQFPFGRRRGSSGNRR